MEQKELETLCRAYLSNIGILLVPILFIVFMLIVAVI